MLVKETAAEQLKRIITTLDKILLDKSRFENALYDCFDKPLDVYSLMAGYSYFAALPKKPKADVAAAAIAKKSKISKDEAKLVAEIWIAARFAGVKDTESTEVVKNKSPQPLAAPVRSSQALGRDAANKRKAAKQVTTEEAVATAFAAEEETMIDVPEAASESAGRKKSGKIKLSKQQKDPQVFYAGKTKDGEGEKPTALEMARRVLTGRDDYVRGYYSGVKLTAIVALLAVGLGVLLTACWFVFPGEALAGMLGFGFGYALLFLFWYAMAGRVMGVRSPLFWAAVCAPLSAFALLSVFAASRAVLLRFLPEHGSAGLFVALFIVLTVAAEIVVLRKSLGAKGLLLVAALSVPTSALVMLVFLALSGCLSEFSYAIETEPFWLSMVLAVTGCPAAVALSKLHKKEDGAHFALYYFTMPALLLLAQLVCYPLLSFVARVEWYWPFSASMALLVSAGALFFKWIRRSPLAGVGVLLAAFALSLLLYCGLFALLALSGDQLLAYLLGIALTVGCQVGAWLTLKKLLAKKREPSPSDTGNAKAAPSAPKADKAGRGAAAKKAASGKARTKASPSGGPSEK